jgi:hypothetical protein
MAEQEEKKGDELKVLFPGEEVDLGGEAGKVKVSPLTLEDMPKVVGSFGKIIKLAEAQVDEAQLAIVAMTELLEILPYCIDRPAKEIPSTAVPEILDIVIEQNVTEAAVGKWTALVQRVLELRPEQGAQDQSKK